MAKLRKIKNSNQEIRHLEIVIESVNTGVKLIAEQYTGIRDDVRDIKKTKTYHTEMIGNLAVGLEVVKEDVKTTKDDLEIVKKDVKTTKVYIFQALVTLFSNSRSSVLVCSM